MITLPMFLLIAVAPLAAEQAEIRLEQAQQQYSVAMAQALVDELHRDPAHCAAEAQRMVCVRALLLLAELCRIEYEQLPAEARSERRQLGARIDEAAAEALALLDGPAESSETQRLRADLYGTMIRTDYQAKKYRKNMETATARALELDPDNIRAQFTAVKPLVFADTMHGRDLDAALKRLDAILAREPGFEQARLLHAYALEQAGRTSEALAEWRRVLEHNPDCTPAKSSLRKYEPSLK